MSYLNYDDTNVPFGDPYLEEYMKTVISEYNATWTYLNSLLNSAQSKKMLGGKLSLKVFPQYSYANAYDSTWWKFISQTKYTAVKDYVKALRKCGYKVSFRDDWDGEYHVPEVAGLSYGHIQIDMQ